MKFSCILFVVFTNFLYSFSQESIVAIGQQPRSNQLKPQVLKATGTIDSTFVYRLDTLQLPLFDDFSKSKFQQYTAQPGDGNVTEALFFALLDGSNNPLSPTSKFSAPITNRRTTQAGTTTDTPLPSVSIQFSDLLSYPVNYSTIQAYPPYIIYDTLDFANPEDTVFLTTFDYIQDSARVFTASVTNPNSIWIDQFAYHNYTHAVNPWSLGVVTFDGLDEFGYPYNFGSPTSGISDFLTSKTIDLSAFSPGDSIYFSFLVQPKGFGDEPEASDSLLLEFYNAVANSWTPVWSLKGSALTDLQLGHIKVTQAAYLTNGFKFRFKNFGGLSGMLDEFHLDYVHLRIGSGYQDTLFKDFAFVYPIGTLLDNQFTQVPWDHWVNDPTHMNPAVNITVRNGSNVPENNLNGTVKVNFNAVTEGTFTLIAQDLSGGNVNYAPRTVYSTFHDFSAGYQFSTAPVQETKSFDIIGAVSAQFPNFAQNDSSFSKQVFANEYAYDDGSAEAAYGITGSQARLAYRFDPYESDTLLGIKMHFVPSVNDVSDKLFLLSVWANNGGVPGSVIYEDEFFFPRTPVYETGIGVFTDYLFKDTALLMPATPYFVGWRQIDANRLNIGFDRNTNASNNTFFSLNAGASWINSTLQGSMMMRPIYSTSNNYDLGIEEPSMEESSNWIVFPNPTAGIVNIQWNESSPFPGATIRDIQGREIGIVSTEALQFDLSNSPKGMYFIQLNNQERAIKKIVR